MVKINHSTIHQDFEKHLSLADNKRILFSGPFGTGKSTFLTDFFYNTNVDYISLSVYPINYCVTSNEDVFELIKYDLLIELIAKYPDKIDLKKEDFTILLSSQAFILQRMKYMPIATALIGLSEKIGKPATEILNALKETIQDFNSFKKEMETDESKIIEKYLTAANNKKGSINEQDDISNLIFEIIERVKEKVKKGDSKPIAVLVIDDLDRLDPEHVFRLFNVFSAHYDSKTDTNKFGFDKVIFVCDVENVRKIFHHRYGSGVDFSGYIDKFYSKRPFTFDNRRFINENVKKLIWQMYSQSEYLDRRFSFNHPDSVFLKTVEYIINLFIESKEVNLRNLITPKEVRIPTFHLDKANNREPASKYEFIIFITLLNALFADEKTLREKLKSLKDSFKSFDANDYNIRSLETNVINMCLPFLVPFQELIGPADKLDKPFIIPYSNYFIHDDYQWDEHSFLPIHNKRTQGKEITSAKANVNLVEMIYDAYDNYSRISVL